MTEQPALRRGWSTGACAAAEEHVGNQRRLVMKLMHHGHDATLANELLGKFEQAHASHIEDRDRVLRELAELGD